MENCKRGQISVVNSKTFDNFHDIEFTGQRTIVRLFGQMDVKRVITFSVVMFQTFYLGKQWGKNPEVNDSFYSIFST